MTSEEPDPCVVRYGDPHVVSRPGGRHEPAPCETATRSSRHVVRGAETTRPQDHQTRRPSYGKTIIRED